MVEIHERDAMDALDLAERARLVADVGPQAAAMRFVHALVAGAVYSELPGRRRRRLHARAAQVLQKRSDPPATGLAAQLARHCALGGLPADALRWARLAGDHAADRLSPAAAARWYRTALEHTAIVQVADHERADLLARLGRAQHQINDPAALATLTEAAALARRCGATPIVTQAALATDRGFLHLGSVPSGQVAIIESALEVIGDGDAATRARSLITTVIAERLRPGYLARRRPRERAWLTASSRLWTPSLLYRRSARSLAADREMPSLPAMTENGSGVGRYRRTWASALVIDAALTRAPAWLVASAAISSAAAMVMRDSATDSAATSSAASTVATSSATASAAAWSAAATMRPAAVSAMTAS
jgi:hypothetical protein